MSSHLSDELMSRNVKPMWVSDCQTLFDAVRDAIAGSTLPKQINSKYLLFGLLAQQWRIQLAPNLQDDSVKRSVTRGIYMYHKMPQGVAFQVQLISCTFIVLLVWNG